MEKPKAAAHGGIEYNCVVIASRSQYLECNFIAKRTYRHNRKI